MAQLFTADRFTPIDGNGHVYAGALLYFYQTGTTTPQTVYSDAGATVALSNPVVADSNGLFPAIYLSNTLAYKAVLQTSAAVLLRTTDPVSSGTGSSTTFTPQGRLTLASGTPVMTANQAAATTIYYTPYNGNQIPVYDGTSAFAALTFAEMNNLTTQSSTGSAGPAAVAANKNYDLFVWSNAGNATLTRGAAWNSDTARSSATENDLQRINGIWTNKNTITNGPAANRGTYVGTVRSDGSSQINWVVGAVAANGTAAILGVWNMYNRIEARGLIGDSTASWTYTTATWRAANASNTMRVSFVQGLQEDFFGGEYCASALQSGAAVVNVGIGFDVTNAVSGRTVGLISATTIIAGPTGSFDTQSLGFHFLQAIEYGNASGTTTWTGQAASGSNGVVTTGLRYGGKF